MERVSRAKIHDFGAQTHLSRFGVLARMIVRASVTAMVGSRGFWGRIPKNHGLEPVGASLEPVRSQFGASFANFQGLDLRAQRELDDAPGIRDLLHVLNFRAEPVRRSKNQKQKSKSKSRVFFVLFSL